MKAKGDNPKTNALGPGITEDDLKSAVVKSGYPLQTIVTGYIRAELNAVVEWPYSIQQEWVFSDKDTNEHRATDICAEIFLYDIVTVHNVRVRPRLTLMVECKQSTLPYVFFLLPDTPHRMRVRNFPVFAGLFSDILSITEEGEGRPIAVDLLDALGLDLHEFIAQCPAFSMSFAKCQRKGKEIELSGSETFHALVLPLLKAMQYYKLAEVPPETARYFDCNMVVGIGVIDAPMVGVEVSEDENEMFHLPWVRVVRHQVGEDLDPYGRTTLFALDVVHKDFFREYLSKHLFPLASEFANLVFKHQQVLASGEGVLGRGGRIGVTEIEPGLKPVPPDTEVKAGTNQAGDAGT